MKKLIFFLTLYFSCFLLLGQKQEIISSIEDIEVVSFNVLGEGYYFFVKEKIGNRLNIEARVVYNAERDFPDLPSSNSGIYFRTKSQNIWRTAKDLEIFDGSQYYFTDKGGCYEHNTFSGGSEKRARFNGRENIVLWL